MSLKETYRRNVVRKTAELIRLQQDVAKEKKKAADYSAKINSAWQAISRISSTSMIKSKTAEIARHLKSQVDAEKKAAALSDKAARKQKEIHDEQSKVNREEIRMQKQQIANDLKNKREHEAQMAAIGETIDRHENLHITGQVEAAIGMNTTIGDESARIFSSQFYNAIGFGYSLAKAFKRGKAALMLEGIPEENTPQLYINEEFDGDGIFLVSGE